jgi:hypothetical protein
VKRYKSLSALGIRKRDALHSGEVSVLAAGQPDIDIESGL